MKCSKDSEVVNYLFLINLEIEDDLRVLSS